MSRSQECPPILVALLQCLAAKEDLWHAAVIVDLISMKVTIPQLATMPMPRVDPTAWLELDLLALLRNVNCLDAQDLP